MKSKLLWYLYPALPGLSILSGVALVFLLQNCFKPTNNKIWMRAIFCLIFLMGCWKLSHKLQHNFITITKIYPEYPLSKLAHELEPANNPPSIGVYQYRHFAKNDHLYLRMLNSNFSLNKNRISTEEFSSYPPNDLVISPLNVAPMLTSLINPRAYMLMPTYGRRRAPGIALWYKSEGTIPTTMRPWCTLVDIYSGDNNTHRNWAELPATINGVKFRGTRGKYSTVLFNADGLLAYYPSKVRLYLASTKEGVSSPNNKIALSLNDSKAIEINGPKEGFNTYVGSIPGGTLQRGLNILSLRHILDPQTQNEKNKVNAHSELSFVSEIEICPE